MKKIMFAVIVLLVSLTLTSFVVSEEIKATFFGVSENDEYIFLDENGEKYFFREINPNIDIDLEDEEYVGAIFKVTYEIVSVPVYDEEGEETYETEEIKKITGLEEL